MKAWSAVTPLIPLSLALAFPSLGIVGRLLGVAGIVLYLLLLPPTLWWSRWRLWPWLTRRLAPAQFSTLFVILFAIVTLLFTTLYPILDAAPDGGSDRDSALNIAVTALADGRYPYTFRTNLGNPISPLPGALLLAAPWVALGNSAGQNLFWLALLFIVWRHRRGASAPALRLWLLPLAGAPIVLHELLTGGDLLANAIYVWLFTTLFVEAVTTPAHSRAWRVATAVLWGIGLASRFNFLTLVPLVLAAIWQRAGRRTAVTYGTLALATTTALILPFYLADPRHFTPLLTANKLSQLAPILPYAGALIPLATGLLVLFLATRPLQTDHALNVAATAVLAFPIIVAFLLASAASTAVNTYYPSFGLTFLFFALAAYVASGDWQLASGN